MAGLDWRQMEVRPFFSAVQALLARKLGGWDVLEERLEETLNQTQAATKAQARGAKMKPQARVMNIEQARKIATDADAYDRDMTRGR